MKQKRRLSVEKADITAPSDPIAGHGGVVGICGKAKLTARLMRVAMQKCCCKLCCSLGKALDSAERCDTKTIIDV